MFGMAFDRMLPAVFGDVNDRTHTPVKAILFTMVLGIVFAVISFTYWGYLVSAANTAFWTALFYLIYSAAAIMLPYKRPDIWKKGIIKTVGGMPLVTILGALSAMGMLWLLALSTIGISLIAWNVSEIWMIIGIVIFVYYARKNSKRGISVTAIFGEVPPP
jgi:APA family basic amino acid/polyamine antiporter